MTQTLGIYCVTLVSNIPYGSWTQRLIATSHRKQKFTLSGEISSHQDEIARVVNTFVVLGLNFRPLIITSRDD